MLHVLARFHVFCVFGVALEFDSRLAHGSCDEIEVGDPSTLLQLQVATPSKAVFVKQEESPVLDTAMFAKRRHETPGGKMNEESDMGAIGIAVVVGAVIGGFVVWCLTKASQASSLRGKAPSVFGQPKKEVLALLEKPKASFTFLSSDFCPFAQRAWIALLEKEENPESPVLFEHVHVCYLMGTKDPGTKMLYNLGLQTVPAAIHEGQILTESAMLASYIDDIFPQSPLKPSDPVMNFNMNYFIDRHRPLSSMFYDFLKNQDPEKDASLAKQLIDLVSKINDDLGKFDGPFLCGEQFTLADINIFGFMERLMIVLPYWKTWCIPEVMDRIFNWYEVVKQRPSVKITTADRSDESMATYCFEAKVRAEYMQELYEFYARNEVLLAKEKQAEAGTPGYNGYRRFLEGKQSTTGKQPAASCVSSLLTCSQKV